MAVPNAGIIGYKTYDEAYKALKEKKAEAIVSDDSILIGISLKDPSVTLLPKRYSKEPYAIAFRKSEESENLLQLVNTELQEALNKKEINKLKSKWNLD